MHRKDNRFYASRDLNSFKEHNEEMWVFSAKQHVSISPIVYLDQDKLFMVYDA